MSSARPRIEIEEAQALFFRARRTNLVGSRAPNVAAAARAILGAQAQVENPALFGLSLRCSGRPTAEEVKSRLLSPGGRDVIRTWGQRDTLHVYARDDWPTIVAALEQWPQSGRKGGMPTEGDLEIARRAFADSPRPLLRRDLFEVIPRRYVDEVRDHPGVGRSPERLAATRLIWCLAKEGELCFAQKEGSEQAYVDRRHWVPEFHWPVIAAGEATVDLTRRYLGAYGPATPADVAHFFGATVTAVRQWLQRLDTELVDVDCGGRRGLLALERDRADLEVEPPRSGTAWPVRLLPQWDTHTMTHKDKSWVAPRPEETKLVWKKAGVIRATVLARGRIVAVWSHRATSKRIGVTVTPLSGWRAGLARQVERRAREFAAHLGREEVAVEIEAA